MEHLLRVECLVELFLAHQALLDNDVVHGATRCVSFLCHLRACLVADDGVEGCNDADAVLHHLVATLLVDGDAENALLGECLDGVLQPCEALEEARCDDWLHHVQLELTSLGCEA